MATAEYNQDFSADEADHSGSSVSSQVIHPFQFPWKLHEMLDEADSEGFASIVSWLPDGSGFKVHKKAVFSDFIMPRYFNQTKYRSFQRQLNSWGFKRITTDVAEKGGYKHAYFIRSKSHLCNQMKREKTKRGGGKSKPVVHAVKMDRKAQTLDHSKNGRKDMDSLVSDGVGGDISPFTMSPSLRICYTKTSQATPNMSNRGEEAYTEVPEYNGGTKANLQLEAPANCLWNETKQEVKSQQVQFHTASTGTAAQGIGTHLDDLKYVMIGMEWGNKAFNCS